MDEVIDYKIRRAKPADGAFIVNSWLRSYNEHIRPEERRAGYWQGHKQVIAALLGRSRVLVAHYAGELLDVDRPGEDVILGYAVAEQLPDRCVIHYVYVKKTYRGQGIARNLVTMLRDGADRVVVTHITTPDVEAYCRARRWGFARNAPFYHALLGKGAA